ncbi:TetR/AcrR family transcriptional regulator [Kitasatospora camelliae]|uniref:TetR/AcrR family transcriptional regulator n=1 Tax=Kitasatospora camelliae TaxID=3156397 RepID=A0AAU8K178_9ACTN
MSTPRAALIADTAIALIAERGLRGLTHRAVDEAAGLPPGSTSNLARTRAALLEAALRRIADLEGAGYVPPAAGPAGPAREQLTEALAAGVYGALTTGRTLTLARFELALEATRRPELRTVYDRLGGGFVAVAADLLARAGSADPAGDARRLIRWCEGVIFHAAAGAGHAQPPSEADLRTDAARYLDALLGCAGAD